MTAFTLAGLSIHHSAAEHPGTHCNLSLADWFELAFPRLSHGILFLITHPSGMPEIVIQ
jgi:hypothetical protein